MELRANSSLDMSLTSAFKCSAVIGPVDGNPLMKPIQVLHDAFLIYKQWLKEHLFGHIL